MSTNTVARTRKALSTQKSKMAATTAARAKAPQKFSLLWWVIWVTLGLALGFIFPSVATLWAVADGRDGTGQFIFAVVGGAIEGGILGFAQAFALRKTAAALPLALWIGITALGGLVAWIVGMIPGTYLNLEATTSASIIVLVAFAIVAVVVMPVAQWLVLRGTKLGKIGRMWRWIPVTALAWTAGIGWLLLAAPLVQDSTDLVHLIGLYTVAGFLMALTIATITGLGMRWMLGGTVRSRKVLPAGSRGSRGSRSSRAARTASS